MSTLQMNTLSHFLEIAGKKTLKQYSDLTGIEKTRFFRLLNGAEMRLSEFEILQSIIKEDEGGLSWKSMLSEAELSRECQNSEFKKEATLLIERRDRLREMIREISMNQAA